MKIKYYVPQTVVVSAKQLKELRKIWIERWGLSKDTKAEMTDEDILIEAEVCGMLDLPEDWRI